MRSAEYRGCNILASCTPRFGVVLNQKLRILEELGKRELLLPSFLERALAANDRVKFLFTLLQTARRHADRADEIPPDLGNERRAVGLETPLEEIVSHSRKQPGGQYVITRAADLHREMVSCLEHMIAPLCVTIGECPVSGTAVDFRNRLDALLANVPSLEDDLVPGEYIRSMTHADRRRGDSLHLFVMDLHKELVRLQADIAQESIDGAKVYMVRPDDRELIRAFMHGVNRTAPMKFDHPGLGTTVTRSGDRLVIQNDIGTTDAHVMVVEVQELRAVLRFTDVHRARALFFCDLITPYKVQWEELTAKQASGLEANEFYLCHGTYDASSREELVEYLEHVGSRIVFLIDWNRARKRLRQFLKNRDCVRVLKWAADHELGHRAFLELGGERLVYGSIEYAAPAPIRFGQRLDELLGREEMVQALQSVLRITAEGLLNKRSARLIRDEVNAEFLSYFHTAHESLLNVASEHAASIADLAGGVRDALLRASADPGDPFIERTASRAQRWEREADELVVRGREMAKRTGAMDTFGDLLSEADDIADGLEEAAYLLTLLPTVAQSPRLHAPIVQLATLMVDGAATYVKCTAAASQARRGGMQEDLRDFLEAVDHIVTIEHETDGAERRVMAELIQHAVDFRQLHLLSELARVLEGAADALARAALGLRDVVLTDLMGGRAS